MAHISQKLALGAAGGFRRGDGGLLHRGRRLSFSEHYFLWRHLRYRTYPGLTFAGGEGERALEFAREAAGVGV